MVSVADFKKKLKKYSRKEIIITDHAALQANFRSIDLHDIKENIINPIRLKYVKEQKISSTCRYDCYFGYSKTQCQRYILILHRKCIVVTVIKINRRWQHLFEKKSK